jgi:hypothetical protein
MFMYKLSGAYVTAQNICTSKTQVRDDCGSKTLFIYLACPGPDQADRTINNLVTKESTLKEA